MKETVVGCSSSSGPYWFRYFSAVYSYFEKGCRKKAHATISKGNMGYDHYTVSDTVAVEPTFAASLWHSETYALGLSCHSFKISMKNSDLKTIHKTFRDCRVHFFRQPLSK